MPTNFVQRVSVFGLLLMFGLAANPALACKGTQTLLRDDFSDEDPGWNLGNGAQIGGGVFRSSSEPGRFNFSMYSGMNFPGADLCLDIVAPGGRPSPDVQGGIGLWTGKMWAFIYIATDGSAGVDGLQSGNWVKPVSNRKFNAIKTTPGAVNQLRVVWKAPPSSNSNEPPDPRILVYVNDNPFIAFKAPPNVDRAISIYTSSGGGVYQFRNLAITE